MKRILFIAFSLLLNLVTFSQITVQAHAGVDKAVCAGDSVQIGGNPISSNTTAPISITWTPNTNISNNTIANPYVWPTSTATYYLSIMDANGRSANDSVVVRLHVPTAVTLDSIPRICLNDDPIKLTSGFPTGGWYKGKSISDSLTFRPNLSGFGAFNIAYYFMDSICSVFDSAKSFITVVLNPTISFSASNNTICKGDSVILKGNGGFTYNWKTNAPISSNFGDSVFTWPDSTSFYWLIGADTAGCTDSVIFSIKVEDCLTGISGVNSDENIKVYPNPFNNTINIENTDNDIYAFKILNLEGKILLERKMDPFSIQKVDLSEIKASMIFIEFIDETGRIISIKKVIKRSP